MPARISALLLCVAFLLGALRPMGGYAQNADRPFLRHPAVHPSGQSVAFVFQGDVWHTPLDGGPATRLTVHAAYDHSPQWSPDGDTLVFASQRHGNDDVFALPAEGGRPHRLTVHSTDDVPTDVTAEGTVFFNTTRTGVAVAWEPEVFHVPLTGGTPERRLSALGTRATLSPSGRFVVFERGFNRLTRKRYRGPANRDLWLYDTETESYRALTSFNGNDYNPVWTGPQTLLFVSDRSGTTNLFRLSLSPDGTVEGEPEALTTFSDVGIGRMDAAADGSLVAFDRGGDVFLFRPGSGAAPERLTLRLPADARTLPVSRETFRDDAEHYRLSPDGDEAAFVVRGELFVTETEPDDPNATRLTHHPYRDRDADWLSNDALIFASDRNGDQYDLYRLTRDAGEPEENEDDTGLFESLTQQVTRLTDTADDERNPVVSPDGERVAFQRGLGMLVVADITDEGLANETVLLDGWAEADDVTWSPDSRWLAYSRENLNFNEDLFILAADGSEGPVNVSQHPRADGSPVWSPDGSKLAFVSERSGNDDDVWFVWLREEDWERTQRDWEEHASEESDEAEADAPIDIDLENIYQRLVRVTAMPGNESNPAFSKDGETLYFVAGEDGRTGQFDVDVDLYRIQWDGSERDRVTTGNLEPDDVRLAPTGEHITFLDDEGQLARVSTTDHSMERLPFAATMTIDHDAERAQIFAEVWRTLEQNFYDPEYHGMDWDSLRTVYRPRAMRTSTMEDFEFVLDEMLGEMNASHMGYSRRSETEANAQTGLLGAELVPHEDGVRVERVVPHTPAARTESRLRPDDVILRINGASVADAGNVYALLDGTAGQRILLQVRGANGEERAVRIRPTDDIDDALYEEWVEERRALVEEYSDGRLGYIHIEGMNWSSFERFERELTASASDKEGLLVDVRFNGGGWTTDYLMTVLDVRRHAYTVPRGATDDLGNHRAFRPYYPFGERRPYAAWTKPVAALCNANSYSNAEIFSHAFKHLDLGPLVGSPTFGAVISTGGAGMIDGSYVRVPFRGWYVYATDQNMENTPAMPDVVLNNPPAARAQGIDPQLERAVDVLLQRMADDDSSDGAGAPSGSR